MTALRNRRIGKRDLPFPCNTMQDVERNLQYLLGIVLADAGTGVENDAGRIIRETARGITAVKVLSQDTKLPRRLSATDTPYYVPGNMWQSVMNCYNAMRDDFSDLAIGAHSMFGVIEIPAGIHQLNAELLFQDVCNLSIVGPEGSLGDEGLTTLGNYNNRGGGICQLVAPATAGKYAIKVEATGSHNFSGPTIKNIALIGNATCAGGLLIRNYSNMRVMNMRTSDFSTGHGYWIDGDGNASQYGHFEYLRDSGSKYGLRLSDSSGHLFIRIMFSGDRNNSDGLIANSIGIWHDANGIQGSDTYVAPNVQGYATLVDIEDDDGTNFFGLRGEGWDPSGIAVRLRNTLGGSGRCEYTSFFGGVLNNNLSGATGTALKLESGVSKVNFQMSHVEAVSTEIDNSSGNDDHVFLLDGSDPYVRKLRCDDLGLDMTGISTVGAIIDRFPIHEKDGTLRGYVPVHAAS